jgi:hypothetical protein
VIFIAKLPQNRHEIALHSGAKSLSGRFVVTSQCVRSTVSAQSHFNRCTIDSQSL